MSGHDHDGFINHMIEHGVVHETQQTINEWQNETFPTATAEGVIGHLKEEFQEFLDAESDDKRAEEAADLVILIYAWAAKKGVLVQDRVDRKMAINRRRAWNIQPDGTGRHK